MKLLLRLAARSGSREIPGTASLMRLRSISRISWMEAMTGPIGRPISTRTASASWSELSSVSGTASVAPAR